MLWQLKCIWCGIFFTGTSLPFEIRLTIVEQNGSNVNATAQANILVFFYAHKKMIFELPLLLEDRLTNIGI